MTFDEWFDQEYPEAEWKPYYMPRVEMKDIMSTTWDAATEELVVRIAKAAEEARSNPGEDITGLSDEQFLAKLFG